MTQRRRVPFILLVALGMVFALATSVLAAGGNLQIKCDDVTVDLANTDTFEVNVRSTGNPSYVTGTVDVTFDDNTFDLAYIRFNPKLAPNNATYLSEDDVDLSKLSDAQLAALGSDEGTPVVTTAGKFCVDFGDDLKDANYTEAGVLFTLVFKVADKNATGEFPIGLTVLEDRYLTTDGELITNVNADDGSVKNGAGITVTITNYTKGVATVTIGDKTNVADETVTATSGDLSVLTVESNDDAACKVGYLDGDKYTALTSTTVSEGKHRFDIPVGISDLVVILKGDVRTDGKLRSNDAKDALKGATATLEPLKFFAADVDNNGKLRSNDAKAILKASTKNELEW